MSEATAELQEKEVKKSEPLFSKKNKKLITDPLNDDNPITVQVLGICSALAITVQVKQAFVKAIEIIGMTAFKHTSMFMRNNTSAGAKDESKAA